MHVGISSLSVVTPAKAQSVANRCRKSSSARTPLLRVPLVCLERMRSLEPFLGSRELIELWREPLSPDTPDSYACRPSPGRRGDGHAVVDSYRWPTSGIGDERLGNSKIKGCSSRMASRPRSDSQRNRSRDRLLAGDLVWRLSCEQLSARWCRRFLGPARAVLLCLFGTDSVFSSLRLLPRCRERFSGKKLGKASTKTDKLSFEPVAQESSLGASRVSGHSSQG